MDAHEEWIIRGGNVVLEDEVAKMDIAIRDGKIAEIKDRISGMSASKIVEADGQIVMAGVVDMHVHLNEPNFGHWEGFETGSAALAAGGCTAYADMPLNGNPPTVTLDALRHKERLAQGRSAVDYALWGGLVPGRMDQLRALADAGVIAFKAFMSNPGGEGEGRFREVGADELREGMRHIAGLGGLLALHAESDEMTSRLTAEALAAGRTDAAVYALTRPVEAELEAVASALALAEETECPLHFVHISSPETVDLIQDAKQRGLDVTLETCPHYLTLSEEDMIRIGPTAKCAPPLRSAFLIEGMWERLKAGAIDFIASDHSPCPEAMKAVTEGDGFFGAWGGIAGAQSTLLLMLEEGWIKRGIPLPQLSKLLSERPAGRFGLGRRKGKIQVGMDADLVLIQPSSPHVLRREDLLQRHRHSPYIGRIFSCSVAATYCRGRLVYTSEGGIVSPGAGRRLTPLKPHTAGRSGEVVAP
ncbi:allantoinase AllB [Paenibacillus sp. PSB04]|uniref:allantoinase AllB n=1 Tax=Paenibacillus sp. PSB04 TaxID=2866810 RepID=UPI0021F1760B|nr:allantoinase AllB [Paenibacillus sp. PSB04]UYO02093.1 allantoinase AllB [Paenibacillus sp. PSB04]